MQKKLSKLFIIMILIAIIALWFIFDLGKFLSLAAIKQELINFQSFVHNHYIAAFLGYFCIYIICIAFSVPGATILTMLAAALFGFWPAVLLVSFASTIGSTLAFLISRYLFRDTIARRFSKIYVKFDQEFKKNGNFYLLTLRLIPAIPFVIINTVMALTSMRVRDFYIISQIGMLPATMIYLNVGRELSQVSSLSNLISPSLLLSLSLLAIFPWIIKGFLAMINRKKLYKNFTKPQSFDYNLIVIGAGAGGLVSSYIGTKAGAKVALIERAKMGGDCLNYGCVPSKSLIRVAHAAHEIKNAHHFGFQYDTVRFDFSKAMKHVQKSIEKIAPNDSVERYTSLGVECVSGDAKLISPWEVKVDGKSLTSKNIIIATGANAFVPPIKGLENIPYKTAENIWFINEFPKKLLVIGSGAMGCELAQTFARLGSDVYIVEMNERILALQDADAVKVLHDQLIADNIKIYTNHQLEAFSHEAGQNFAIISSDGEQLTLDFDLALLAMGRKASTQGLGLEELGIELLPSGVIATNEYLQTTFPNIYAVGDVAGPYQFTHTASHQAWYAAFNALFGVIKRFKIDYNALPVVIYTSPELAQVGLTETQAKQQELDYVITQFSFEDNDRAICEATDHGFIKILTKKGSDKILGATIIHEHAGDILTEITFAMKHKLGLNSILKTIHPHPTLGEANKSLAGIWKQSHISPRIIRWGKKFNQFMRR